jgi:hypothetical protein
MIFEKQLDTAIDKLCNIKAQLKAGNVNCALLTISALELTLQQLLTIHSLGKHSQIEHITCDDYPRLQTAV